MLSYDKRWFLNIIIIKMSIEVICNNKISMLILLFNADYVVFNAKHVVFNAKHVVFNADYVV